MKKIPMLLGPWYQDNVAAGQLNVALNLNGNALRADQPIIRNGSILGIALHSNEACTAGTLVAEVTVNGLATGLTTDLDALVHTTDNQTTQNKLLDAVAAGALIGARITSSGLWAPATADITVTVLVEQ